MLASGEGAQVEARIAEEEKRAMDYLDPGTRKRLMNTLDQELIVMYAEKLVEVQTAIFLIFFFFHLHLLFLFFSSLLFCSLSLSHTHFCAGTWVFLHV